MAICPILKVQRLGKKHLKKVGKKTPPLRIESENLKSLGGSLEPLAIKTVGGAPGILTKWAPDPVRSRVLPSGKLT